MADGDGLSDTHTKKSISALELQRELRHKRYEPIWAMLHKIRLVMRHRDSRYELKEYIEMDEGFFEASDRDEEKKKNKNQQGRGSARQVSVLVAVESKEVESLDKNRPNRKVNHLKMTVMNGLTTKDINYEAKKTIDQEAPSSRMASKDTANWQRWSVNTKSSW